MFQPPIKLAQIQKQFVSWFFRSNSVSNLNFLPQGKLFIMPHSILMQSLDNFGAQEGSVWYFTNLSEFE
jgi:hypothetical protein